MLKKDMISEWQCDQQNTASNQRWGLTFSLSNILQLDRGNYNVKNFPEPEESIYFQIRNKNPIRNSQCEEFPKTPKESMQSQIRNTNGMAFPTFRIECQHKRCLRP
jgi:hypothetical protein